MFKRFCNTNRNDVHLGKNICEVLGSFTHAANEYTAPVKGGLVNIVTDNSRLHLATDRNFDAHGAATVFSLHNYFGSAFLRGLSGEDRDPYVHRELPIACD